MPIEQDTKIHLFGFGREKRLTQADEFTKVFKEARRKSDGLLTLLYRENSLSHPRLGLAIAKKSLPRAHDRNRIKRLIREQFRLHQNELANVDMVLMCRPAIKTADNPTVIKALNRLFNKAKLLNQEA